MKRALPLLSVWLGCASPPPTTPHEDIAPRIEMSRLENGVRIVTTEGLELGLYLRIEPEIEPFGLEGASGLLVELATESAGPIGEASPHARALALGGRLEAYADGALVGWRLVLGACGERACPTTRIAQAWALLFDVALTPDLRASTVTRRAEQYRDRLDARTDGLGQAARRWAIALAAGHGRPVGAAPTERAASIVTREALVRLHRALMDPERMVAVGPLDPLSRARLAAWTAGATPTKTVCGAPTQVTFGLAATGPAHQFLARRAPGRGMMGRRELEAALVAARAEEGLRDRRVELIDVGAVAVLVEDGASGADGAFQGWLERAPHAAMARAAYDTATLAEEALTGVAPAGPVSLGPPITVWFGDPARFPTLPVMLGRDTPRCRP